MRSVGGGTQMRKRRLTGKRLTTICASPRSFATAVTDSRQFARRFAPSNCVRWCKSCSLPPRWGSQGHPPSALPPAPTHNPSSKEGGLRVLWRRSRGTSTLKSQISILLLQHRHSHLSERFLDSSSHTILMDTATTALYTARNDGKCKETHR